MWKTQKARNVALTRYITHLVRNPPFCMIRQLFQIPLFNMVPKPGFRPGGRPTFSLAREKVGKERAF